jgi:hypothetical protein
LLAIGVYNEVNFDVFLADEMLIRMIRNILVGLVLWWASIAELNAQQVGRISGEVITDKRKAIEGVVVSLFNARDSILVKAVLTEESGKFEYIQLPFDTFYIVIAQLGFLVYKSKVIILNAQHPEWQVPLITLVAAEATELKDISIRSKSAFIERKVDRTVVNPDALISNAGANALEVLEKSPGVQVDLNGAISLKGKQGVLIYIDDKPTYLAPAELANYLRSIAASGIAFIEILTNPPAKYDAAGNAGIINIRLKKTKAKGFNGSVTISYGQGFYLRNGESFNFNYRVNRINIFANGSYNIGGTYQDLTIRRSYYTPDHALISTFSQHTFLKKHANNANFRLGFDYYINKKSTFGIALNGFNNLSNDPARNLAGVHGAQGDLEKVVATESSFHRKFENNSANLNYSYRIDSSGKEISANVDYLGYNSKLHQSLLSYSYQPDLTLIGRTNLVSYLPSTIQIGTAKVDYTHPMKGRARGEAGLKTSLVKTDNIADFADENNNILTVNNEFSNHFKYNENINAAYLNYSREQKKISYQAGLRYENTTIHGDQLGNAVHKDSVFVRKYNSLFPTCYLSYKFDSLEKHQLGFSYGRRIDRPNYQDMNPFTYPLDRFTLYAGNPFLQPTFSNNFELSHTFNNKITTTINYTYTRNVIHETVEQSTNIFYSRPGNIGKQISYGVSVTGELAIKKWWSLQFYTEWQYNDFQGVLYHQQLRNKGGFWFITPTSQFQLSPTLSLELGGNYQTSMSLAQFVLIPVGSMRIAAAKKLFKNKATLKMSISDFLYTNQPGGEVKSLYNSTASWHSYLDSRVVTVAFSYRFNKGQNIAPRKVGGSDSEKTRVH